MQGHRIIKIQGLCPRYMANHSSSNNPQNARPTILSPLAYPSFARANQCSRFRKDGLALAPLANSLGHLFSLPKPSGGVLALGGGLPYSGYDACAALDEGRACGTEAVVLEDGLPYSAYDPCAVLDAGRAWGTEAIVLDVGLPYSGYDPSDALDDGAAGGVTAR